MTVLSTPDRLTLERTLQRRLPRDTGEGFAGLSVADFRAAINSVDDWVEANTASFNTGIPQPARGSLTTKQKAWLLMYVVARRAELS